MLKDFSKRVGFSNVTVNRTRVIIFVFIVMFLAVIGSQIAVAVLLALLSPALGWWKGAADVWYGAPLMNFISILLSELLAIVTIWYVARLQHVPFRKLAGLRNFRWNYPLLALGGVGVYFILFACVYGVAQHFIPTDNTQQALGFDAGIGGASLWLAGTGLVVLPPIAEEIVFRGFFYGTLRHSRLSVPASVLLTSLAFGSLHLFTGASGLLWVAMIDTFTLSIVLCLLREKTGSIWTGIFVHALKNGFVFLNLFIMGGH